MVLGMSLETFTLIHVLISLVGIASGLIVLCGFLTNKMLDRWTAVFLVTTTLTSLTGFLFPFTAATQRRLCDYPRIDYPDDIAAWRRRLLF